MKLKTDELIGIFDACQTMIDKETPIEFTFKLAKLITALNPLREAFALSLQKIPTVDGKPEESRLIKLCDQTVDANLETFTRSELAAAFDRLPAKVLLALRPLIEEEENA